FHAEPNARQVGRHDAMPIFFGRIDNTRVRPYKTGIVEGIVQASIVTNCARHHMLHVGWLAYISADTHSLAAISSNRRNGLFAFCNTDTGNPHPRALSRKSDCVCAADARRTASHHDDLPSHKV